jgi:hypothetical protein
LLLTFVSTIEARAQLTVNQRAADLAQLMALYDKNYGPYEWKRDVIGFDLLNPMPWASQARSANDLDFQELLISYVASLNDAHSFVSFHSGFVAELPFRVDIYDGRILIDSLYRPALPIAQYPFTIGDELLSMDGQPAWALIGALGKYTIAANQASTDRLAADLLTYRAQWFMPHAHLIGDSATVEILLAATGQKGTFTIPWSKSGTPITFAGPVPSPSPRFELHGRFPRRFADTLEIPPPSTPNAARNQWQGATPEAPAAREGRRQPAVDDTLPDYMAPLRPYLEARVPADHYGVLGFGSRFPVFAPPPGFVQRLGASTNDFFLSGTYVSEGVRIGFLRIPSMVPPSASAALTLLNKEIAFFNANTDGLVVDVMRNPGGSLSFMEALAQRMIPSPFRTIGVEIRATARWMESIDNAVVAAELGGAPPEVVQNLKVILEEIQRAFGENRGRTAPVSLNFTGSLTLQPAAVVYQKPLMVLVDGMSASAADMLPAIIQDNHRGPLFGMRTMGAGGSVVGFNATAYTEGFAYVTLSLANRGVTITTDDFPPTPYIENVGVRPDVTNDYMTRANLMSGGQSFVQGFTHAIVNLVQTGSPN